MKIEIKKTIKYIVPKKLFLKWIRDVCDREGRPRDKWYDYQRVRRTIFCKACTWAAHRFGKDYPHELGIDERWRDITSHGSLHLVEKGQVELIKIEIEVSYEGNRPNYHGNYSYKRLKRLAEENGGLVEIAVEYPQMSQQEFDILEKERLEEVRRLLSR